ncbi:hypothetical protein FBF32_03460 [Candidatus Saccharibacteria bacterium oral taxon 488]|jgi:hypothetical protein|nr:hypothetical protein FBF32_03460 [Candidatus Saccharibacteria bacterium oral taxon 488]QJU10364.1 hypothetical protein FBF26_03810 [Candidatus Saccharibacteria bacterium oral taxon 488]
MSGGHEQISKNPNFKRLVPMDESRAELTELGTSEEEQDKRLGREAAEKVLGEVAVGESKNTVCKHRERQATVREILQTNGGSMYWPDLIDVMTKPPHSFLEGEAVMALLDDPKGFEVDHFNLIVSISDR